MMSIRFAIISSREDYFDLAVGVVGSIFSSKINDEPLYGDVK